MANTYSGNSIYIDSTGVVLDRKNIRVSHIVFTSSAAADNLILKDTDNSGDLKLSIKNALADETTHLDFSQTPLHFSNAIYVDTITSGATATLILNPGQ